MKSALIDAGPLIALFDKDDKYHTQIIQFLKKYDDTLVSSWPVLTEVCHMLDFNIQTQVDFLEWIKQGAVKIHEPISDNIQQIIDLTKKNKTVPMDLAEVSLVIISEELGIKDIITIDSDYYIYRTIKKEMLNNIFL